MSDKTRSLLFDGIQIGSLAYIFLTGPILSSIAILTLLQLFAIGILLEAVYEMRRTKFYRVPDIGKQRELVRSGIYAYVRNPMYLSELLYGALAVMDSFSWYRLLALLLLFINFLFKISYEETLLGKNFVEFADYKRSSWKLLPFIY